MTQGNIVISIEQLNDTLKQVGNTPLLEPELFEAIDENAPRKSEIIANVLARSGYSLDDILDIDARTIAEFYNKLVTHITSSKDEEGNFKTTPATASYRLPNFMEIEHVADIMTAFGNTMSTDKAGQVEALSALDDYVWQITKLKKDELTFWEQQLIIEQVLSCYTDVERTSMGKPLPISLMGGISTTKKAQ